MTLCHGGITMGKSKMSSGSLVTIEYERERDDFIEFSTIVEANYEDAEYLILAPMYHGRVYLFKESDIINVICTYITEDDRYETYSFKAKPIERIKKNDMAYLKIKRLSAFKKMQRRDFFRLEYVKDISLNYEVGPSKFENIMILSKDLSAGGMRAIAPKLIKAKTKIILFLDIGEEILEIKGKIVRVEKIVDSLKNYDIRIQFEYNKKSDISKLTQYVLRVQATYIRKMAQSDNKDRPNLEYSSSTYRERRIQRDWINKWLDLSVVAMWFLFLIVSFNFLMAKPPWKFGVQNLGYAIRTTWDVELIIRNLYFLLQCSYYLVCHCY